MGRGFGARGVGEVLDLAGAGFAGWRVGEGDGGVRPGRRREGSLRSSVLYILI